ncbi:MAG: sterol desaturase family protein [Spirosomataceae bacterium]
MIAFLENLSYIERLFVLLSISLIVWNIEVLYAFRPISDKSKHLFENIKFIALGIPAQLAMGSILNLSLEFNDKSLFGLIEWFSIKNNWINLIVSFLLLDFFEYIYHIFMHKFRPFWVFHLVHHSEQKLDISSILREHPIETIIRLSFTTLWVLITGVHFWMYVVRQLIQVISNLLAHGNFRLTSNADKIVSLLFVTPNMHHVHHHFKLPHTDSNYGDVLSIWDRLFGTYKKINTNHLVFGIDTEMCANKIYDFKTIIMLPFKHLNSKPETINTNE